MSPFDLRHTGVGRPAPFLKRFDYSAIYVGASPGAIKSIDHPSFEKPAQARLLAPSDLVVGLSIRGDSRAYPVDLLSIHEVVNDIVGNRPVAVTWCPLCSSALAFDRRIGGRVLTFGVSGFLYHANQILFDRQTGSLWSQLAGGAVTGRMRGTPFRPEPLVEATWQDWLRAHPKTLVLSIERDSRATDFTRPRQIVTARGIEETDQPYGSYFTKVPVYYPRRVRGIVDGSRVLGVLLGGRAKAYPIDLLRRTGALDDVLAGQPVLVVYDGEALSGAVFSRRLRGRTLTFRFTGDALVDLETGSRWSTQSGRAVAGPLAGASLRRLPSTVPYWFAWRAFHADTALAR